MSWKPRNQNNVVPFKVGVENKQKIMAEERLKKTIASIDLKMQQPYWDALVFDDVELELLANFGETIKFPTDNTAVRALSVLATFLLKGNKGKNSLFIFDEPTTGLHFHDIKKLLKSFNSLIENGHSIIVVEHNLDLIKCADHIIDLGPNGGENGGELVYSGKIEKLYKNKKSALNKYLDNKINV